jgi:hypothetical protein
MPNFFGLTMVLKEVLGLLALAFSKEISLLLPLLARRCRTVS